MGYQEAWKELMEMVKVLKQFDLQDDEAEAILISIEHINSEIVEEQGLIHS